MLSEVLEREEIIERVAALDIGKAELVCCVRVPAAGKRRAQEVSTRSTMTRSLALMCDRLAELGVTRVVMEATSDYSEAAVSFYLRQSGCCAISPVTAVTWWRRARR